MANPPLGSLVDPFTAAAIGSQWNNTTGGGTVTLAAAGRVSISATSATPQLGATGPYNAAGQALYARVTPALAGTGGQSVTTTMRIAQDASNYALLTCVPGVTWTATVVNAGTPTVVTLPTFDPAAHAWWQIAESSGSWLFAVSLDGVAWTQVASIAYTWSPTGVSALFSAGSSTVSGQHAYIEHVNTLAGAGSQIVSWPQVQFQVAFNQNASASGEPSYVDLSPRLRGPWSAQLAGRQYELDQIQSGQLTCTLWNLDGALDPLNTSSPYYPNVDTMKPCRLLATWPPTRNLHDSTYASGTSINWADINVGSITTGTVPPAPTGHSTAILFTFPAANPGSAAFAQGDNNSPLGFPAANGKNLCIPGGSTTGGTTWTASVWLSAAAGTGAGITGAYRLNWFDQTGNRFAFSTSGSSVTIPASGTWVQASVTATAPAGTVGYTAEFLVSSVTTVSSTICITASQIEQGPAVTPWTPPGVTYPLWAGYVERWPQQWDQQGTYGLVDLTCVDALASLAQFTMSPNTPAQILALGPTRLYPLDEPVGSTKFRDMTGKHIAASAAISAYGAGTLTAGNSITGAGFVGAPGPVVTLANPAPSNTASAGSYINIGTPYGPPAGGWTRLICFRTTTVPASGTNSTLWNAAGNLFGNANMGLFIDSSQHVNAQVTNAAGTAIATSVPTVSVCDGNWHMAAIILDPTGKILNINVDGAGFIGTSTSDCHPTGLVADTLGANVVPGSRYYGNFFSGDIAYACEVPTNNVPSFPDIAAGFATGWAGESSAARAQRILTLSGYMGALGTQDMTTAMGGASLSGQDAMSALQLVADSESGQVYVDATGTVELSGRLWRYYQNAPAVLIGEQQAGGEIPYLDDIAVEFDTTHIYNQVSVTNQAAPGAPQQPAALSQNTASATAYAPRTQQVTINVQDTSVPQYAANYIAQQYGAPLARIAQLTVDPASNPALWSTLLGLGFGSRVQVSRRPPSGPGAQPLVLQQFLEHLTWNGDDKGNFRASMQLSSATPFLGWWVVSSLHTTVNTTATFGVSTIVLNPLTGSAGNPAAAVLPIGTVLTLSYGDPVHQENVTVQSVAATTAGYASVAITLAAPTVHSHAAGSVVCQPLPGGYTLPALPAAGFPASLDAAATLSATGPRVTY